MNVFSYLVSVHGMSTQSLSTISGVKRNLIEAHYCYGKPLGKKYKMQIERAMFRYLLLMGDISTELKEILDEI